jgi:hypothetical protein
MRSFELLFFVAAVSLCVVSCGRLLGLEANLGWRDLEA